MVFTSGLIHQDEINWASWSEWKLNLGAAELRLIEGNRGLAKMFNEDGWFEARTLFWDLLKMQGLQLDCWK